jgi:hypothetical protein
MQARVKMILTDTNGVVIARREAKNSVMRGGGELIARLFAGVGQPITHMAVGTSDAATPDDFVMTALKNEAVGELPILAGDTDAALPSAAFVIAVDAEKRLVTVKVRGTLPQSAAVGTIREAGLVSKSAAATVLYNRVTFAPLTKGNDHELTLFWEVSFPYGDLNWF